MYVHCSSRNMIYKYTHFFNCSAHIYDFHTFTVMYSLLGGFIYNQDNDQLPVGSLAQLVEHFTGITEVMGSNSIQA